MLRRPAHGLNHCNPDVKWHTLKHPSRMFRGGAHSACTVCSTAAIPRRAVEQSFHTLPDGMRLEVLRLPASSSQITSKPPLLFVHGSYHGAWCWEQNFMPYFAAAGYDTIAISLRAQGNSDRGQLKVSGNLQSHADDLASVIQAIGSNPPVLIGHSFGGLLAQKYVSQLDTDGKNKGRPGVAGVALLCSVPPSGNKDIVGRITKKSPMTSLKITWAFVSKSFARNLGACRETFFSPDIPESDLVKYQEKLAACSPIRLLDLRSLNKELPIPPLPQPVKDNLPAFVGGGETDLVVDPPAVNETAAYFGIEPVMWVDTAHDCMLDTRWERAAASLRHWLDSIE